MAAKGVSFHLAQESIFASELERRALGVYTERHDDRYGGQGYHERNGKTKMAILKITFKQTYRQVQPLSFQLKCGWWMHAASDLYRGRMSH